jgi:hypothetical protein
MARECGKSSSAKYGFVTSFYDWTTVDFISRRFKVEDDGNA